jgi:hypothetical protein
VWLVRSGHRCGVPGDCLIARVPLISLMVNTPLRWLAEAYHVSRNESGCYWLLNVSGKARVELRRKSSGLVIRVDLIIIMVGLLLSVGWSRLTE